MLKVKYGTGAFCAHVVSFSSSLSEFKNAYVKRSNGSPCGQQKKSVWNYKHIYNVSFKRKQEKLVVFVEVFIGHTDYCRLLSCCVCLWLIVVFSTIITMFAN